MRSYRRLETVKPEFAASSAHLTAGAGRLTTSASGTSSSRPRAIRCQTPRAGATRCRRCEAARGHGVHLRVVDPMSDKVVAVFDRERNPTTLQAVNAELADEPRRR
jgi:hypothetical protein